MDERHAEASALFVNAHRGKGAKAVMPVRFMPPGSVRQQAAAPAQTPADMLKIVEELNRGMGGRDLRKKKRKARRARPRG